MNQQALWLWAEADTNVLLTIAPELRACGIAVRMSHGYLAVRLDDLDPARLPQLSRALADDDGAIRAGIGVSADLQESQPAGVELDSADLQALGAADGAPAAGPLGAVAAEFVRGLSRSRAKQLAAEQEAEKLRRELAAWCDQVLEVDRLLHGDARAPSRETAEERLGRFRTTVVRLRGERLEAATLRRLVAIYQGALEDTARKLAQDALLRGDDEEEEDD